VLALLVALAGCNLPTGPAGPADPADPVTPAPVPEGQYPPGLTTTGLDNATALSAAHAAGVRDRSMTATYRERVTLANGSELSRVESRLVLGPGWTRFLASTTRTGARVTPFRATAFANESGLVSRQVRDGERSYDRDDGVTEPPTGLFVGRVAELLGALGRSTVQQVAEDPVRFRVRGPVRNAEEALRYEPTGPTSAEAVVDSQGVVRQLRVTYETDDPRARVDEPVRVVERIEVRDLGTTTVERPAWTAEAAAAIRADRPAGLGEDRITDRASLLADHREALAGEQVQVDRELRTAAEEEQPRGRALRFERALIGGDRATFYRSVDNTDRDGGTTDRATWSNRTVSVTETYVDDAPRYGAGPPMVLSPTGAVGPPDRGLEDVLAGLGTVSVDYTNGRYVAAAERVADPGLVVFGDPDRAPAVRNVSAEVRFDRDGAVESVRIEYGVPDNGTHIVERIEYDSLRSGPVPTPSWVGATLEEDGGVRERERLPPSRPD
jgi:hypothetical protein